MTSPAPVTLPYTVPTGGQSVRLTDGTNNPPAGLTLVNRGDNGATVWISAGPALSAASIPLGPGATMQWTDRAAFPYAALTTSATLPETLVVTSQADGYANPSVVAAALVAQGIPSTMLDTGYGTFRLSVGNSTAGINVGQSASLIVSASWPQPTPTGANVVRLKFDDPAVPDLPPIYYYLTNNNAVEAGQNKWQVPVVGPRLTVTNLTSPDNNNADAYVQVAGTNRPCNGFRQLGAQGQKTIYTPNYSTSGQSPVGQGSAINAISGIRYDTGDGPMTRFNGPVTLTVLIGTVAGNALLIPWWVDINGRLNSFPFQFPATGPNYQTIQWNHPPVPVYWTMYQYAANANNYAQILVTGAV